jgi:hypothetical protein
MPESVENELGSALRTSGNAVRLYDPIQLKLDEVIIAGSAEQHRLY